MKEIVIAAYDRNLEWVHQIYGDIKSTIYRKGNSIQYQIIGRGPEIQIDSNLGRDVHTFFHHIYERYDSLSEYTFFTQDYPFDHWGNLIEVINGSHNDFDKRCTLNIDNGYFGFHNNKIGTMWIMQPSNIGVGKALYCQKNGLPQDKNLNTNLNNHWKSLFVDKNPGTYEFIPGGHFILTKSHAQLRSRNFYKNICQLLLAGTMSPWVIERLECYIFNPKFKSKIC